MAIYGDDDIDDMYEEWGNTITVGDVSKPCILDERDAVGIITGDAGQVNREIVARIKTSNFPDLAQGDDVSIDGRGYTVWNALLLDDGGETELTLRISEGS